MIISLEEAKLYLRVDHNEDDRLIEHLILSSEELVRDITRIEDADFNSESEMVRIAALYALAYLYEHREDADHKELTLTLRALLFGIREARF